ncbi:MAG: DNA alkylation repair protein [Alistipes sp.]|nr:DNA alkylation repair protein [Alistipes sp.]
MDNTSRMISLLGKMRKQMNGAVADSMFYYGENYGLNYGVSLPTVREIAQAEGHDHNLAQYLFKQQVRELKLAAFHIAEPALIDASNANFWAEGIINSELAEEAAFAMLSNSPAVMDIFTQWIASENEFTTYAAMMAAARCNSLSEAELQPLTNAINRFPDSRPIARGAVAMLASAYNHTALQPMVKEIISALTPCPAAEYIIDEMSWRMEV